MISLEKQSYDSVMTSKWFNTENYTIVDVIIVEMTVAN
jgi:hypothetical protein